MYDFTHVTYACAVVYGYVAGLPTVMWLGFKYLGAPISLLTLLCLYGYSMVPFIPAAVRRRVHLACIAACHFTTVGPPPARSPCVGAFARRVLTLDYHARARARA